MRMTTSRSRWVAAIAAGAFLAPVVLRAQDSTQTQQQQPASAAQERTHVVKEGDTLWDLARQYLGDPFLWPEIYRLNTSVVEDPHWIYPGERLRLPGGTAAGDGIVAEGAGAGAESGAEAGAAGGIGATQSGAPVRATSGTVFLQRRVRTSVGAQRLGVLGRDQRPVVREGEFYSAPFMSREEGPSDPGRVLRTADISGISTTTTRTRFQAHDQIFVDLPKGKLPIAGDRYLAYRKADMLDGIGRVIVPTAIIIVDRGNPGEATLAHVDQLFEELKLDQPLIPLEQFPLTQIARPEAVERGPEASIVWIQNKPVLPSLHHYMMLDATTKNGVKVGDQFTIFSKRGEADGEELAPRAIATLQVVRVTSHGTTVLIVDQEQPSIKLGMKARLSAKMP